MYVCTYVRMYWHSAAFKVRRSIKQVSDGEYLFCLLPLLEFGTSEGFHQFP